MDLYPGFHIRWLISGNLYSRANNRGLCPGGLYPGAHIRWLIFEGQCSVGLYSELMSGGHKYGGSWGLITGDTYTYPVSLYPGTYIQ